MSLRLLILILCSLLGFTVKAQQYPFADIELTAKTKKTPFEVAEVQVDSITGRITITGKVDPKTGIAPKVTLPKGRDYVITDSQGKVYQLDESGKVTAKGTREQGTQLAQQAGKGDSKNPPISNKHFKVEWLFNDELANDTNGEIPYKALVKGKTSSFELRIQPADTTKYDFFFHTENGVKVEAESKGEGLYKITRKGAFDFAQEELWVVAKEKKDKKGKKEELIGKCILVHLSPKEVNVALVPTQSGQNLQEAIAQVQQIYEKVGVTLHITTEKSFDISDQLKNGTLPTENEFGDLSTYSPEQNAVIAKFATNRKPKDNTYYIFLVNDGTGNHGYMRLGGQYGFVYSANARTIAHELGHGIFKLEHPFKGKNADKGKTSALMDYNQGQDFFYRDWKQINDPKVKLYAFQGQGEGEFAGKIWLTPDWRPFKYDRSHTTAIDRKELSEIPKGALPAILGEDKNAYYSEFSNGKFIGYKNSDGLFLKLDYQTSVGDETEIYLYRTGSRCGSDTYYKTTWGYIKDKKEKVDFLDKTITFVNTVVCNDKVENQQTKCNNFVPLKKEELSTLESNAILYLKQNLQKINSTRGELVNTKGNFSHIYFKGKNGLGYSQLQMLEDKLHLLSYYTNVDMVVSILPITNNSMVEERALSDMAKKAIKAQKSSRKIVYILVATSNYESILGEGLFNNDSCYSIGYAESQEGILSTVPKGNTIFENVVTLFKGIEKPLLVNRFYCKADGTILNLQNKYKVQRGYPFIHLIEVYESSYYQKVKDLESGKNSELKPKYSSAFRELGDANFRINIGKVHDLEEQRRQLLLEANRNENLENINPAVWKPWKSDDENILREVFAIDPQLSLANLKRLRSDVKFFENSAIYHQMQGVILKPNVHFYSFKGTDLVYLFADSLGVIPVIDILGDLTGFIYASYRGDWTETSFYSLGMAIPIGGVYLKTATKADELVTIVAREAKNGESTLEVVPLSEKLTTDITLTSPIVNNSQEVEKVLEDVRKLYLENGKQIANLAEDLSKKTNNILTKAFSEGSKFIDDTKTIEKITHYLAPENTEKLKAIGDEQGLIDFLKKYKDAPCGNCKDAGRKIFGGRTLDEMLENYVEVAHTFRNRPDLWKKIEEGALSSNAAMREGTQHMLSTFKKNPKKYTPENIEHLDMKFEKGLDDICANCRYDVKFNNNRNESLPLFEEFKSYNTETWSKIANDKGFIKQFESYLQEVDEIKDLAYVINSNKANINEVKQAFKELFKKEADNLFRFPEEGGLGLEKIRKLFGRDIKNTSDFLDKVEDINNPIYNFIKTN